MKHTMRIFTTILIAIALGMLFASCKGGSEKQPKNTSLSKQQKKQKATGVLVRLSDEEKQQLIKLARNTFDTWVKENKVYEPKDGELSDSLKKKRGNRVFATIYHLGEWRGCVSAKRSLLYESVIYAVINTCKDRRFQNPKPDEIKDFRIEINVLQPEVEIKGKDIKQIAQQFLPGVEGLMIKSPKYQAFFLPYVFVKKQRTLKQWLERLSKKATGGKDKDLWSKPETKIYKYPVIDFIEEEPYGKAVDLYRYRVLMPTVSYEQASKSVESAYSWLNNQFDEANKRLFPGYFGKSSTLINREDLCDQTVALRAMIESKKKLPIINKLTSALLSRIDNKQPLFTYKYRSSGKEVPDYCANLNMAIALIERGTKLSKKEREFLKQTEKWALSMVRNGKIDVRGSYLNVSAVDHAGGLAMQFFSAMAQKLGSEKSKSAANELWKQIFMGFKPTREGMFYDLFRGMLAYFELTNDSNVMEHAMMLAENALRQQWRGADVRFLDYIGGIKKLNGANTTDTARAVLMWAKAISVANTIKEDKTSIKERKPEFMLATTLAVRFLMEHQFNKVNGFFFQSLPVVLGGFWREGTLFEVRPGISALAANAINNALQAMAAEEFDKTVKENPGEFFRPVNKF